MVSDHGTEFTSNAMPAWCEDSHVDWHFIAAGKPTDISALLDQCPAEHGVSELATSEMKAGRAQIALAH